MLFAELWVLILRDLTEINPFEHSECLVGQAFLVLRLLFSNVKYCLAGNYLRSRRTTGVKLRMGP